MRAFVSVIGLLGGLMFMSGSAGAWFLGQPVCTNPDQDRIMVWNENMAHDCAELGGTVVLGYDGAYRSVGAQSNALVKQEYQICGRNYFREGGKLRESQSGDGKERICRCNIPQSVRQTCGANGYYDLNENQCKPNPCE